MSDIVNPRTFATYILIHLRCGHDQDLPLLEKMFSVAYESGWNGAIDRAANELAGGTGDAFGLDDEIRKLALQAEKDKDTK